MKSSSIDAQRLPCHALWAKSNEYGGYPLPMHLLDVAAVAYELCLRLPDSASARLARELGCKSSQVTSLVSMWAGMHDLGKATPGFQRKWQPGRLIAEEAGFPFGGGQALLGDRHDAFSFTIANHALKTNGLPRRLRRQVVWAIAAHHGFGIDLPPTERDLSALDFRWRHAHGELTSLLGDVTGAGAITCNAECSPLSVREWLAGLISIVDWIGSDKKLFPQERRFSSYQSHWCEARDLARSALDEIGFPSGAAFRADLLPRDEWMRTILGGRGSRPLQSALVGTLLSETEPELIVIEAPMGEGKTEAALWAVLARSAAGERGVYFALPTQATANGLVPRVETFLDRFAVTGTVDLQVVHGGARRLAPVTPEDINAGAQDSSSAAWFGQRRRGLIAPVGVGTIDQALIGVLEAKHRFVRLFSLADRTVVLDEIHAYDAYTSVLIERLLQWLGVMGSSVVLMSATLPRDLRDRLVRAWTGKADKVPEAPYPRLVHVRRGGEPSSKTFESLRVRSVVIKALSDNEVAKTAEGLALGGAAVLIVCNTVARAQDLFLILRSRIKTLGLFHARYPADERARRELRVLETYGVSAVASEVRGGSILVATQVVEQSLDVDFDVLITDMAPVDLLLQRVGRVHRHVNRIRPPTAETPTAFIIGLRESADYVCRKLAPVYAPGPVVRSLAMLEHRQEFSLPGDIDLLVQSVYAADFKWPNQWIEAGQVADRRTREIFDKQTQLAVSAVLPKPTDIGATSLRVLLEDDVEFLGTRLGQQSSLVAPIVVFGDRFASDFSGDHSWRSSETLPKAMGNRLASKIVGLSQGRVVAAIKSQAKTPPGWDKHPALSNVLPWYVDSQGRSIHIPDVLALDQELGVTYGRRDFHQ